MTEEQIELGRRAVACKGWRWMPGMLCGDGFRCTWVDEDERELAAPTWCANGIEWLNRRAGPKDLPDLTDHATLGCLLALVREAWGDKAMTCARVDVLDTYIAPLPGGYPYSVIGMERRRIFKRSFGSEAEALVAALEAAP